MHLNIHILQSVLISISCCIKHVLEFLKGGWVIPGQAVAVKRGSMEASNPLPGSGHPRGNRTGTLRPGGVSPGLHSVSPGPSTVSDDEEDFYDALDAGSEFDVTLPSLSDHSHPTQHHTTNLTINANDSSSSGGPDSISTSSSISSMPIGTDLVREYESDLADSDMGEDEDGEFGVDLAEEADDDSKKRRRRRKQRQEAHVIQKHGWGKAR